MIRSAALLFAAAVAASACQSYDFERVTPLAVGQTTDKKIIASKRLKPNIMLLLDNSGSMSTKIDTGCANNCATRISEMKASMNTFFTANPTLARFGAAKFPLGGGADLQCAPTNDVNNMSAAVPLPAPTVNDTGTDADLTANAQAVNALIQGLVPAGGTPTGSSLQFFEGYGGLNDQNDFRDDFVLLLTDGLPNCNPTNDNNVCMDMSPAQTAKCACVSGNCTGNLCALGCLDQDGTVAAIRSLKQKGIRTIVVGFGTETGSGAGLAVLQAMAQEGGFPRECPNGMDSECGTGNTCDTTSKLCTKAFFQAANGAELSDALAKISDYLQGDPCVFGLSERPSDPRYLSVVIDGQTAATGADTFTYDAVRNEVTFQGELCTRIKASTNQNPISVEFRIVQKL